MSLRNLSSLHKMGEVTNSEQDPGLSVKCRTTLPAHCRSLAEQAAPGILQRTCLSLMNLMVKDTYCWNIFRNQIVCPKEKAFVHSRPESSSCSLSVKFGRVWQTVVKADWHGGRAKVGGKQELAGQVSGAYHSLMCSPSSRFQVLVFEVSKKAFTSSYHSLSGRFY